MTTFQDFKISKHLLNGIQDLGFDSPTPIQEEAFSLVQSGRDVVGISQTGTGKTLAFMLPLLNRLKFSNQASPRILILVPTRELVVQLVEQASAYAKYVSVRIKGVYGGTNLSTQAQEVAQGCDILVGTPGRMYDLLLHRVFKANAIQKLVIDEVDVMLDLGFRFQVNNILELLPERRQNIMFSATMTEEVDALIDDFFDNPAKITIAASGTPLENIHQKAYRARNFYTKVNLVEYFCSQDEFEKVLLFASSKKMADLVFAQLELRFGKKVGVLHSNKSQNYRLRTLENLEKGEINYLVTTDIMARGVDLDKLTHVVNIDVPAFPENYMHRIGRTGRAEEKGEAILCYTDQEEEKKLAIEVYMNQEIEEIDFPEEVVIETKLLPEERTRPGKEKNPNRNYKKKAGEGGFHEKKDKNKKTNLGSKLKRIRKAKYKKPKTRGDKIQNRRKKK